MSHTENGGHGGERILVVEDEPLMRVLLADNLGFEGYRTCAVGTAEEGLAEVQTKLPALVILDVNLPNMSGFEFCRQLRAKGQWIPIIMLTARGDESDRVIGLDLGADDYVTKPFQIRELLARVRAQLRRGSHDTSPAGTYVFGDFALNLRRRLVTRNGRRMDLSAHEFDLLRYLVAHRGEVVTREQLLKEVWGYNSQVVTRTVDNFVAKLRTRVERKPHEPRHIITVHGKGYQFLP
ncbi:MAG: response regulator transcription factor [Acidobacteriota bacterium]